MFGCLNLMVFMLTCGPDSKVNNIILMRHRLCHDTGTAGCAFRRVGILSRENMLFLQGWVHCAPVADMNAVEVVTVIYLCTDRQRSRLAPSVGGWVNLSILQLIGGGEMITENCAVRIDDYRPNCSFCQVHTIFVRVGGARSTVATLC